MLSGLVQLGFPCNGPNKDLCDVNWFYVVALSLEYQ